MATAAQNLKLVVPAPGIRRFQMPDLSEHGGWILARLLVKWPHHNEHSLFGFLRGVMNSSEFLFLYQEHAVALATVCYPHPLEPKPVGQEIFVLAENEEHIAEAAAMYEEIARWCKTRGIDVLVVEEMTDVPHDTIKERIGRVFTRQQQFVRF